MDGVDVLQTYNCSLFRSSPQALGCSDGPLRLFSALRSRFEPEPLTISPSIPRALRMTLDIAHHMLPPRHQSFVDNLRGIVASRVYMHTLLNHRVRPCAQRLSRLVPTRLYLGFRRLTVRYLCRHCVIMKGTAHCSCRR